MKKRVMIIAVLVSMLAAGTCLADDWPFGSDSGPLPEGMIFAQGPGQGHGPMGGRHGQDRSNRRRNLEQLRILKMLEILDLNEDQELEFLTAFRSVRKEQSILNAEKEGLIDSLSAILTSGKVDERAINGLVDRVIEIEDTKRDRMKAFVQEARTLLDPEQVARFMVFAERFERQLLEQVKSFRDRKGPFPEPPVGEG